MFPSRNLRQKMFSKEKTFHCIIHTSELYEYMLPKQIEELYTFYMNFIFKAIYTKVRIRQGDSNMKILLPIVRKDIWNNLSKLEDKVSVMTLLRTLIQLHTVFFDTFLIYLPKRDLYIFLLDFLIKNIAFVSSKKANNIFFEYYVLTS